MPSGQLRLQDRADIWEDEMRFGIILAGLTAVSSPVFAQSVGLLIGNEDYRQMRDVNRGDRIGRAKNDLDRAGIQTTLRTNATLDDTIWALSDFAQRSDQSDMVVIALSGRFVHSATDTYFLPVDQQPGALGTVAQRTLPLSTALAFLAAHPGDALLVLATDEARGGGSRHLIHGLGQLEIPQGVTVLTGSPTDTASFLRRVLPRPGRPFLEEARAMDLTVQGFAPEDHVLLESDDAPQIFTESDRSAEILAWRNASNANTPQAYDTYLNAYPNGEFARMAENRLRALTDTPQARAERAEQALDLSRAARRDIQRDLTLLGFNTRGVDGIFGRGTRSAVAAWQKDRGAAETGFLDRAQITDSNTLAERRAVQLEAEAQRRRQELLAADQAFWDRTSADGSENSLRTYLNQYPDGEYAEVAQARLEQFEQNRQGRASAADRRLWQQVRQIDSLPAYEEYLRRAPQGAFRSDAETRIRQLNKARGNSAQRTAAQQSEQALNLSPPTRQVIEARLNGLDMKPGKVDGIFDRDTRRAIRRYQASRNLDQTGFLTEAVVVRLLADSVRQIFR